jgi:hypothetical protein
MIKLSGFNPLPSGIFKDFAQPLAEGVCDACGLHIRSKPAVRIPGVKGVFCSGHCVESQLFGTERCRWCGTKMEKAYTSIDSRLCSDTCSQNYYAHVLGDRSAAVGTGKRFAQWLQANRPAVYRQMADTKVTAEAYCQNPACSNGEGGMPASIAHLRAGTLFCGNACKMQARRSPNHAFEPSKTAVFIEVSSNAPAEMA